MKVLVIHRQEAVVTDIKVQMSHWSVRSALSGLDGLLTCRTERFDLILCAIDLPVITGIELIRSVRILSSNQNTPIVLLREGNETPEQLKLMSQLSVNLLTLKEVQEIGHQEVNY